MMLNKFACNVLMLIATFFTVIAYVPHAYAAADRGDIFSRFKKPMPELKLLSNEEFTKASKPVKKMPYNQKVLAYTVRIPKDWEEREDKSSSNFLLSEKLFLELSVFYGKPTIAGRSRFEVQALNLEGNLTAEQWYIKYILEGGYTTEGLITHNDKKVESLMVIMGKDYSYYVRTLVMLNGDKVLMAKYFVPVHYIREEAVMQAQVLSSFELTYDVARTLGDLQEYRFLDIAQLKYPMSWKVYTKPLRSVDRIDVSLLNLKQGPTNRVGRPTASSTEGKLDVTLVAAAVQESLVEEVDNYKKKIEASGMLIGDRIHIDDEFYYDEGIDFALTEVYKGVDSSNNVGEYEFWFTVMVGGNYYFFFTLLTPSRNERFGVWAKNTQNYKLILENFSPMAGAFLERDY